MRRCLLLVLGVFLTSPAYAETFSCESSQPQVWGLLTIHVDRNATSVTIEGDRLPGAKLAFVDRMIGPVEVGASDANGFGTKVVPQFVRVWDRTFVVGWRDVSGEIEYSATISRSADGHCHLEPSIGPHTG